MFDITLLTDKRYLSFKEGDWYNNNVVEEDRLVAEAFTKLGWKVTRTYWDDPDFDWTNTRFALFRTTWDYFDRFEEFSKLFNQKLSAPFSIIFFRSEMFSFCNCPISHRVKQLEVINIS